MATLTGIERWVKRQRTCDVLANADSDRASGKWLAARRTLITASEVPIVLGITGSISKLWHEKVGLIERENYDDVEYAQMGHHLEAANAELFHQKTGRHIERAQLLLRSRKHPWLGCTLDYLQWLGKKPKGEPAPLELKSTGIKDNWPDDGEPHLKYQAQLQTQVLVMGTTFGSLSAIIGSPYFHHRWEDSVAHAALAETILDRTRAFWDSVQVGTEPPFDDSEDANWTLRHLALEALSGDTVPLPEIAIEWTAEWERCKEALLAWRKRKTYFENLLMSKIGLAEKGILPRGAGALTLKLQRRAAYAVPESFTRVLRKVDQ